MDDMFIKTVYADRREICFLSEERKQGKRENIEQTREECASPSVCRSEAHSSAESSLNARVLNLMERVTSSTKKVR